MDWNSNKIEELVKILEDHELSEIKIAEGDSKIVIKKAVKGFRHSEPDPAEPVMRSVPAKTNRKKAEDFSYISDIKALRDELEEAKAILSEKEDKTPEKASASSAGSDNSASHINAPIAGIFFRQAQPDAPPYAEAGQHKKKGDVIGIIEAMKMFYEVRTSCDCVIKEFLAENEQFVEYNKPIAVISEE